LTEGIKERLDESQVDDGVDEISTVCARLSKQSSTIVRFSITCITCITV